MPDDREGRPPVAEERPAGSDERAVDERPAVDEEPRAREVLRGHWAPLLDPCARWERVEARTPSLPMWVQPTMPTWLDPADWGAGFLAVHEREISMELQAALKEQVPQAFLRDLFRPVTKFYATPEEIEGTKVVGRWKEGAEDARAAQQRAPVPVVTPSVEWVKEEQRRRSALMAADWKAHFADDAPRRHPELLLGPDESDD